MLSNCSPPIPLGHLQRHHFCFGCGGLLITSFLPCPVVMNHFNHFPFQCPDLFNHTHFVSDPWAALWTVMSAEQFKRRLMGKGFMWGGDVTPFTNFFDFCLRSSRYDNKYLPMLSKLSQASLVKIFQISGGWVSWHPPLICTLPHES